MQMSWLEGHFFHKKFYSWRHEPVYPGQYPDFLALDLYKPEKSAVEQTAKCILMGSLLLWPHGIKWLDLVIYTVGMFFI